MAEAGSGMSGIEIERTREEVKVIVKTARPGLVIGPRGAEVDKLKDALEDFSDRRVNISIVEIRNPDLDAQLVAEGIAEQLKRRASFRLAGWGQSVRSIIGQSVIDFAPTPNETRGKP